MLSHLVSAHSQILLITNPLKTFPVLKVTKLSASKTKLRSLYKTLNHLQFSSIQINTFWPENRLSTLEVFDAFALVLKFLFRINLFLQEQTLLPKKPFLCYILRNVQYISFKTSWNYKFADTTIKYCIVHLVLTFEYFNSLNQNDF